MAYVFVLNSTEVGIVEIDRGVPDADLRGAIDVGPPQLVFIRSLRLYLSVKYLDAFKSCPNFVAGKQGESRPDKTIRK